MRCKIFQIKCKPDKKKTEFISAYIYKTIWSQVCELITTTETELLPQTPEMRSTSLININAAINLQSAQHPRSRWRCGKRSTSTSVSETRCWTHCVTLAEQADLIANSIFFLFDTTSCMCCAESQHLKNLIPNGVFSQAAAPIKERKTFLGSVALSRLIPDPDHLCGCWGAFRCGCIYVYIKHG